MGFDLVVRRTAEDEGEGWLSCGWDKAPLFRALCALGSTVGDGCATVPTGELAFVAEAGARVAEDRMWSVYTRLVSVDWELADEWLGELSARERAEMLLTLVGDETDYRRLEVLGELWSYATSGWPDSVTSISAYVGACMDDGVGELYVFGG